MTIEQAYTHERSTVPHRRAIESDIPALVGNLQKHLGQALVAVIVDSNPRTIARWITGASTPAAKTEKLLRNVSQIFEVITAVESPAVARAWFMGMNPQLDDQAPAELLADDPNATRAVLAAARAFAAGG